MSTPRRKSRTVLPELLEAALCNEPEILGIDGFDSEKGADFVREVIDDLEFWHDEDGCYVAPIAWTKSQWQEYKEHSSLFHNLHMKPTKDSDREWLMQFYPNGLEGEA